MSIYLASLEESDEKLMRDRDFLRIICCLGPIRLPHLPFKFQTPANGLRNDVDSNAFYVNVDEFFEDSNEVRAIGAITKVMNSLKCTTKFEEVPTSCISCAEFAKTTSGKPICTVAGKGGQFYVTRDNVDGGWVIFNRYD
jgi:hypothetical protein